MNSILRLFSLCCLACLSSKQIFVQVASSDWNISKEKQSQDYESLDVTISIKDFKNNLVNKVQVIELPNPNGLFESFEIYPVQVVGEEVSHLYTIKTFRGHKIGDASVSIACDISNGGFHAAVLSNNNSYFIEPVDNATPQNLEVYYINDKKSKPYHQVLLKLMPK